VYTKWLNDRVLIVAIDESDIVGFAQFNPRLSSIEAVHVSPKHAGRGIGRALVNEVETKARSLGTCKITANSSLNAVAFYSKCGYLRRGPGKYRCKSGVELETVMFEKGICGEQTL
jgi:predicted N-acetyltransferase YhbS